MRNWTNACMHVEEHINSGLPQDLNDRSSHAFSYKISVSSSKVVSQSNNNSFVQMIQGLFNSLFTRPYFQAWDYF